MFRKARVSKVDLNQPVSDCLPNISVDENAESSTNIPIENVNEKEEREEPTGSRKQRWYTKQTADPSDRDFYVVTVLKELLIYITFLIIVCIVAYGMTSNSTYFFRKAMSTIFIDANFNPYGGNFRKATQIHDFWKFAEKVLIDALYWDHWHNFEDSEATKQKHAKILYENELIGLPRLRQLRVRRDSCVVHEYFRRMFDSCYDSYSSSAEDKETFGPGDGTAWRYHSPSELGGSSHTGVVKSYPPGGYYLDLYPDKNETVKILANLKKKGWIDRGTRVVFLDLTVYNANVNLFCIIKLVMEFPPTGGVVPSWTFQIADFIRYTASFDYLKLFCEVVFVLLVIFYTAEEIYEMFILKKSYLYILWSYVDLIILTISWTSIFIYLANFIMMKKFFKHLVGATDKFCNFEIIGYWHAVFNNLVSLIVLLAWLKLFKYFGFNKTMTQLGKTVTRSIKDVAGFSLMFLIVFFAFVQLGYLLFGSQARDFSTFGNSTFALMRIILGDFDFEALRDASPILGPIFFFCYVFFIFFILLNMFLAIINETFIEVKSEIHARREDFELVRYLKKLFGKFRTYIGLPPQYGDLEGSEGKLSHKAVKENLRKCNFSDIEIETFFAKYGLSGEGYLTEKEVERMTNDLYGAPIFSDAAELDIPEELEPTQFAPAITREEFDELQDRILQAEITLEVVVDKIESLTQLLNEVTPE